jgi:8-oxo-dGTP pyrophosphatase MutT (NUDIX family)
VVIRGGETIVIVPTRRAANGRSVVALPKGHVDPGETELVEKLGDVRYWYQRDGRRIAKVVSFYLFDYRSGDVADHDAEVEEARWVPLEEAVRQLTYRGEREMVERALERVRR